MEALKDLAERKMMDNLSTDNMVKFFLVGDQYKAEGLRMKAKDFIKLNIRMLREIKKTRTREHKHQNNQADYFKQKTPENFTPLGLTTKKNS